MNRCAVTRSQNLDARWNLMHQYESEIKTLNFALGVHERLTCQRRDCAVDDVLRNPKGIG